MQTTDIEDRLADIEDRLDRLESIVARIAKKLAIAVRRQRSADDD